jgi:hypothetical protein
VEVGLAGAVAVRSAGWDCGAEEWMWIGINRWSRLGAARGVTDRAARYRKEITSQRAVIQCVLAALPCCFYLLANI